MPPAASARMYPPGSVFTTTWWVQVARFTLIALVLVLTGAALWPRGAEATLDDLITDLRAGDVVAVEIGEDSAFGGALLGGHVVDVPGSDAHRVRWRTADADRWRTFLTSTQAWSAPADDDGAWQEQEQENANIGSSWADDPIIHHVLRELARTPDGVEHYTTRFGSHPAFVPLVTLAVWLIVLGTLIHSQQPRWVTKWGWFWLLLLTPYGLGFLALLALDAPWSRAATSLDPPLPHHEQRRTAVGDRRLGAVRAVAVALLASMVVASVVGSLLT